DAQGHQVIVEWQRIDAATVNTTYSGHSLTVLAEENGGTVSTNAQGVLSIAPGVYTGALDVGALSSALALSLGSTGNAGGSLQTDGRSTGYFTETEYNALGYKIASNAGDGLWRQLGVDGKAKRARRISWETGATRTTTRPTRSRRIRHTTDVTARPPISAPRSQWPAARRPSVR